MGFEAGRTDRFVSDSHRLQYALFCHIKTHVNPQQMTTPPFITVTDNRELVLEMIAACLESGAQIITVFEIQTSLVGSPIFPIQQLMNPYFRPVQQHRLTNWVYGVNIPEAAISREWTSDEIVAEPGWAQGGGVQPPTAAQNTEGATAAQQGEPAAAFQHPDGRRVEIWFFNNMGSRN